MGSEPTCGGLELPHKEREAVVVLWLLTENSGARSGNCEPRAVRYILPRTGTSKLERVFGGQAADPKKGTNSWLCFVERSCLAL